MAKDFDSDPNTRRGGRLALDREFKLGGESFRLRSGLKVGGDALEDWRDVLGRMTRQSAFDRAEAAQIEDQSLPAPVPLPEGHTVVQDEEFVPVAHATLHALLAPGQETALDRVLANDESPIMIPDLFEVVFWAVGVVTGRPTDASSPSSSGSTTPTTEPVTPSSTDDSSSPEAAASAA